MFPTKFSKHTARPSITELFFEFSRNRLTLIKCIPIGSALIRWICSSKLEEAWQKCITQQKCIVFRKILFQAHAVHLIVLISVALIKPRSSRKQNASTV